MKSSIFDGWTSEKQCFGIYRYHDGTKFCAIGWAVVRLTGSKEYSGALTRWHKTCDRIAPLLIERFPELKSYAELGVDANCIVQRANDVLHVPAEVFLSLDLESMGVERETEVSCEEKQREALMPFKLV